MVPVPGIITWYAWSPYNTKKAKCLFLHGAARKILPGTLLGSSKMKSRTDGAKMVRF